MTKTNSNVHVLEKREEKKEKVSEASSSTTLSVVISQNALSDLKLQRSELMSFIRSVLNDGVDFGEVPGTSKPSLYKPGAEKLANLFKLGTRIVNKEKDLDLSKQWAMFSYTIEVFHLPTGQTVAQCEGSANSQEKRYRSRPAADMINTLQKMAQKRAYVGAVIIATGASDFFTQDVEDMDPAALAMNRPVAVAPLADPAAPGELVCHFGKYKDLAIKEIQTEDLASYVGFIRRKASEENKPIRGQVKEFIEAAEMFLTAA